MSHVSEFEEPYTDVHNPSGHDPASQKIQEEKDFDKAVYGGISYAAQAGAGILLTRWIRHGSGRKYFDAMAHAAAPLVGKLTGKTGEAAVKEADAPIIVSTMIMVGNMFVFPVKWLENRKPQIVRAMAERNNQRRLLNGEDIPQEELAAQSARLDTLDKEPKQSWGSLWAGRGFGLGAVYATLWAIGTPRNQAMENFTAKSILNASEQLGLKKFARSETAEQYLRIGFYDVAYSMVSAGGLYVWSHFLHPKKKNNVPQPAAQLGEAANGIVTTENAAEPSKTVLQPSPDTRVNAMHVAAGTQMEISA